MSGPAALSWRLAQQALEPANAVGVAEVAERVLAARAWPLAIAELTFASRQTAPEVGAVGRALASGELVQSYAFRGGAYVFAPEIAAVVLAVRTTSRAWESRRWQAQGGFEIDDWDPVREAVRERLGAGPATRDEIADHLRDTRSLAHLAEAAATGAGADSLYKPLHWWGDIAFGPARDGAATFRLLRDDARWPGLPDPDDAGRRAISLYLRAYGPATTDNLSYWLTEGLSAPRRRVAGWLADLGPVVTTVSVAGAEAYALTDALVDLGAAVPSEAIHLLPPYDPWVLGPGTADPLIVSPQRRRLLTNGGAAVLRGGFVVGTWRRDRTVVSVAWFDEAGPRPVAELQGAVQHLAHALGTDLTLG